MVLACLLSDFGSTGYFCSMLACAGSRAVSLTRVNVLFPGLVVLLVGCGSKESGPPMAPVSGIVKYEGEPVAGAIVTFVPIVESVGYVPASGKTNDEGEFELQTRDRTGALCGPNRVAISAPNPEHPFVKDPRQLRLPHPPSALEGMHLIPLVYADPIATELTAEVASGQANVINFELTEDGTGGVAP